MSSSRCFADGCTSKLYGKCECQGIVLFCKKHLSKHVINPTPKGHQCIRLYFKPAEEIKQPIIDMLKQLKQDIKTFKADAINKANDTIKNFGTEFKKYINQINDVETRCNEIIKILLSGEKALDKFTQDDIESVLKLSASDIQHIRWNIDEWHLNYNEVNEAIKNIFKIPFRPLRQYQYGIIYSDELSFFRKNSQNFATINLNTFQISSTATLPNH